jgi:hypothetical protein
MLPSLRILLLAAVGSLVQAEGTAPPVVTDVTSPLHNFSFVARPISGREIDEATGGENPYHNGSDAFYAPPSKAPSLIPSLVTSDRTGPAPDGPPRQPAISQYYSQPTSSTKSPAALSSSNLTSTTARQPGTSQRYSQPNSLKSNEPTSKPTLAASSIVPTVASSHNPGDLSRAMSSLIPSEEPTSMPTNDPSGWPTVVPSSDPTGDPSQEPSDPPQTMPSLIPTGEPTSIPTNDPSGWPTVVPSSDPTGAPSQEPSEMPSLIPATEPTSMPTNNPSELPTSVSSLNPTSAPSHEPSSRSQPMLSLKASGTPTAYPINMSRVSSPAPSEQSYPTSAAPTFGEISTEVMVHPVDGSVEYQTTVPLIVRGISPSLDPTSTLVVENAIAHFLSEEIKDIQGIPVFFLKTDIESQSMLSNPDGSSMTLLAIKVHAIVVGSSIEISVLHDSIEVTLRQNQEGLGKDLIGALSSYSESTETNKDGEKNISAMSTTEGSTNEVFLVVVISATMMIVVVVCIGCLAAARIRRQGKGARGLDGQTSNTGHSGNASNQPSKCNTSQSITHQSSSQEGTEKRSSLDSQNITKNSTHTRSRSYGSSSGHSAIARIGTSHSGSELFAAEGVLLGQNSNAENVELVGIMEGDTSLTVAKITTIIGGGERTVSSLCVCSVHTLLSSPVSLSSFLKGGNALSP